jgi:MoaA/NifB/PqqE/SkfB family radical SAM enzyme
LAKDVRGKEKLLRPEQWANALTILEQQGVVFHLLLGNELFVYPWPVELVKALRPFHGRYAVYSTFPQPYTDKYFAKCVDAGLYNISCGVDSADAKAFTGDIDVDHKAVVGLEWLVKAKKMGVPDVQATITIHAHNWDKLRPIFDFCTDHDIWVGLNLVEYSLDGRHDFYPGREAMASWLISEDNKAKFRDEMYSIAAEIRTGKWKVQLPSKYLEEIGDREVSGKIWHCSEPAIIHLEEDGALRACGYRGPLKERHSVFELGGRLTMEQYISLQRQCTMECPGCGTGGWSYWWMAEYWQKGPIEAGDKVFQTHKPGYEFEREMK